jgi:hypothetical protein
MARRRLRPCRPSSRSASPSWRGRSARSCSVTSGTASAVSRRSSLRC